MDALEFAKQKRRMCGSIKCVDCKLFEYNCTLGKSNVTEEDDKRVIEAVEQWATEHPERTRQSAFLDMFPDVKKEEGVVFLYPCDIEKISCDGYSEDKSCNKCREEYWLTPLEDE